MNRIRSVVFAFVLAFPFWCALSLPASPAAAAAKNSADVTVNGDSPWIDTGMDVNAGDKLHITATGTVDFKDKAGVGPAGAQRGWADTLRALSVQTAGRGALIGQIGNDRGQDCGYARAEAVKVFGERDHFHIWKTPFKGPKGETLWAGAGTHDIGIEKDQRKENAITHKIDPAVDGERDFIASTLKNAGMVEATGYVDRPKQIKETKTATGGEIKTDGRTLVIVLKP